MKLMVLDGNSIINRSFYGIRPLTTKDGLYTNAIYGFLTTMDRLLEEEKPEALCVTFDRREPTFRHQADSTYKATRHGMPEELAMQMPYLKEVLDAMNIPRYEMVGYEADDLIGTISRKCEASGWDCVVVTGDKDSLQLITDHTKIKLVSTRMGQTTTKDMTPETFREQYGFDPIHMIDLKALMGDTSDNITGVPGIGEKTAMALVQEYQSIDALYQKMPEVNAKPAALKKLSEGEESARHSYWLATIVTDVPMTFAPQDNIRREPNRDLYRLFLKLEFKKLIDKYGLTPDSQPQPEKYEEHEVTSETVTEEKRAEELLQIWRENGEVVFYALPDLTAFVVDYDESEKASRSCEFYFDRYQGSWNTLLQKICGSDISKVSHQVKDLMRTLLDNGITPDGFVADTAIGAYLLDATAGNYEIERLFMSYYQSELPKPIHLEKDAFSLLGDTVAAEASFLSWSAAIGALWEYEKPRLQELQMWQLYTEVEMPLCRVLAEMERAGMRCNGKALSEFGIWLETEISALEQSIYAEAGQEFNINSPKQLGKILFEDLALPHGKKTKTGWSTNADVLEKLKGYPIVSEILTYRQYAKLKSTYADGLLKALSEDGRIHTNFQMTVTATGRLSSTEPNLQNIPTRTELGSQIRKLFIPERGNVLVDADYSQIELRLLACIAGDEAMIEAFRSGRDFHTVTASRVFHVDCDEVTPEMRRSAKAVNFGIVYGISAFSLSQDINVSVTEAKEYIDRYFATYPKLAQYMNDVVEKAGENGFVETRMHRRRALPELSSSNHNLRAFGERVALNMPIQGTAADIIKLAMVRVWQRLKKENLKAELIMQVHDELIVECPAEEKETVKKLLTEEMEQVIDLPVRLIAEAHDGDNWLSAKG